MESIAVLIGYAAILIAAMILGNWFLAEIRRCRVLRRPWYGPYLSPPGILIVVLILVLPIIVRYLSSRS